MKNMFRVSFGISIFDFPQGVVEQLMFENYSIIIWGNHHGEQVYNVQARCIWKFWKPTLGS